MGQYLQDRLEIKKTPSISEQTEDPITRDLAIELLAGYNAHAGNDILNSQRAITTARAIDNLIRARLAEALISAS